MEFLETAEAKRRSGLRLVTVGGVPSPWSEAAKGIFRVKGIPFVGVRFSPGDADLRAWTGCDNAPVALYDDEKPRSGWAEILLLAERLRPEPRLIPDDPEQRAWFFGLAHEICGEMGLGWSRRVAGVHDSLESDGKAGFPKPIAGYLGSKYGYRGDNGPECRRRAVEVLKLLARCLEGRRYYLGDALSALDIYSAAFMGILSPLEPENCPMPDMLRSAFESKDPETTKALDPILLAHRDFIYREYLELPVQL
jgi:glutathione S-transferase